jgi:hypothetical protein
MKLSEISGVIKDNIKVAIDDSIPKDQKKNKMKTLKCGDIHECRTMDSNGNYHEEHEKYIDSIHICVDATVTAPPGNWYYVDIYCSGGGGFHGWVQNGDSRKFELYGEGLFSNTTFILDVRSSHPNTKVCIDGDWCIC